MSRAIGPDGQQGARPTDRDVLTFGLSDQLCDAEDARTARDTVTRCLQRNASESSAERRVKIPSEANVTDWGKLKNRLFEAP